MYWRRACLAVLVLGPWIAVAGALAAVYGLTDHRSLWWVAGGCLGSRPSSRCRFECL
jgi:hypothetical protein